MAFLAKVQNRFQKGLSFFPVLVTAMVLWVLVDLIHAPDLQSVGLDLGKLAFLLYLFPLLFYRVVNVFAPLQEGYSYISNKAGYSAWLGARKIQSFYDTFPILERILIMIPGAYSAWLRLWGSKVGQYVHWTPQVEIVDRTHLDIGDYAFFGNHSYLSPHLVRIKNGKILLYLKTIKIGSQAFIGFYSRIGPGVKIGDGVVIPAVTDLYTDWVIQSQNDLKEFLNAKA